MFCVTVIAMGRLKEGFYVQAAQEYAKRLGAYCRFQLLELPEYRLPEDPSPAEIADALAREGRQIREKLPKGAWFCVLTPEGKKLSSEGFARTLAEVKTGGRSSVCFLLGSSFDIAPEIKALADLKLSFSDMTFPHHLARIMLLEQIYRAESIQAGSKYHK